MTEEENKILLNHFWERVFNQRELDLIDKLFTSDWVYHGAAGQELNGPEELKEFLTIFFNAFPDIHVTVEDMIIEGDKVVTRAIAQGTHKANLMGIAPTEKQINCSVICISRVQDGKITEDWEIIDLFGMLQQLGVIQVF